jgi:HAD superfamily hydrolase (TIGR01450 family)
MANRHLLMTRTPTAFLLDMDGVLYHGERVLPAALAFMGALGDRPHAFITNNPILPPAQVADKLQRMGFQRPAERLIVTSAEATADWLAAQHPGFHYFAVGAQGLHLALAQQGREDPDNAEFVVVGEGPGLDYGQLTRGINLVLKQGARLVVTNPDLTVDATVDGEHRILPGGGALVAPFAAATGREPVVIGKPQPLLYRMALERIGCAAADCLMIGDRPDTDIAGAVRLGMLTALVRTGRFAPGEPWPDGLPRPDWDVADLYELLDCLNL